MPARLLAYGGTSFSERRRIGQWPAVPEATLRDPYGLSANAWSFGVGTLGRQPFLILRQRQNVENRGGYPFSLLLDPGEEVWERFDWNGAAIVAQILQNEPELLLQAPERCSAEALESLLNALEADARRIATQDSELQPLLVASAVQNEPTVAPGQRPSPGQMAAVLDPLPMCFRLSAGWLVGGGAAHGRALGANLIIDDQATSAPEPPREQGRSFLEAWEAAPAIIENFKTKPIWTWEVELGSFFQALVLLRELESVSVLDSPLLERVEHRQQTIESLDRKIEHATTGLLSRGAEPLGAPATSWLLGLSLRSRRKLDTKTAARLDRKTALDELRRFGVPPKSVPRQIQLPHELRVQLWTDYLDRLRADVGKNLDTALSQLGELTPDEQRSLAEAAFAALPASDEKLSEWDRLQKFPEMWAIVHPALEAEAERRARLEEAQHPAPVPAARRREPVPSPELRNVLESLLFNSRASSVERQAEELRASFNGTQGEQLDDMIAENCAISGARFATAFSGKYAALGVVMSFFSEISQDRLIDCLAEHEGGKFQSLATRDITQAINNAHFRNAYSRALTRYLLDHPGLRKTVALRRSEEPRDFERKLKSMLAKKGRRA